MVGLFLGCRVPGGGLVWVKPVPVCRLNFGGIFGSIGLAIRTTTMDETIENNPPPVEVSPPAPVSPGNPPPENNPPPPAATLATQGTVTDEQALALQLREAKIEERERRAREVEQTVADRERKAQEREDALRAPGSVTPAKTKRKRNWSDPVICDEEVED